jgi:hypothetical protein
MHFRSAMIAVAEDRVRVIRSTQKPSKIKREYPATASLALLLAGKGETQKPSKFSGDVRFAAETSGTP